MKLLTIILAAAVLLAADTAPVLLEAAKKKEVVDGDLKGAIKQYGEIASRFAKTDRAVAASALVRMAECHSKLGDAEAQQIYQRVVREFADQQAAVATARARMGPVPVAAVKNDRAVWTGPKVDMFGRVSPNGKYISFVDWNNGRLMVHDIAANQDRELTAAVPNFAQSAGYSVFSSDGREIAFNWLDTKNIQSIRVAAFRDGSISGTRTVFTTSDEVRFIDSFDWSPDRKWLAAAFRRKDGSGQIVMISTTDGSHRVLKSIGWRVPDRIFFSPDGRLRDRTHP